jgi:hypothetical protein
METMPAPRTVDLCEPVSANARTAGLAITYATLQGGAAQQAPVKPEDYEAAAPSVGSQAVGWINHGAPARGFPLSFTCVRTM